MEALAIVNRKVEVFLQGVVSSGHNVLCSVVYLVHVKNEVQLADTFEALVKCFDENLNEVKDAQFGFRTVDTEDEVEGRIMPVYQFVVRPTDETKSNTNKHSYFLEYIRT